MKKVLLVVLCALTLFCLCACHDDPYKKLNQAIADYTEMNITVEMGNVDDKLTSTFAVKKQDGKWTVDYRIEKFTEITDTVPTDYITVRQGSVEVVGSNVTGDVLSEVSFVNVVNLPYVFKAKYFENAVLADGVFTADVFGPQYFTTGHAPNCTDMKVVFQYEAAVKVLAISYVDNNGVSVTATYAIK